MPVDLPAPWLNFLSEIDSALSSAVELHCTGGFVLAVCYQIPRFTADLDFIAILGERPLEIERIAGVGSSLHRRFKLYVQRVTVAEVPDNYETRLRELAAGRFAKIRLMALDPYDLLLAKLTRNSRKDREDVNFLAHKLALKAEVLEERYEIEMRPWIPNSARHDLTIRLWIEDAFPK